MNFRQSILVREEVWQSQVSLLRAYSDAAGLNHGMHTVEELNAGWIVVRHKDAELEVNFQPEDGHGSWRIRKQGLCREEGLFQISDQGILSRVGQGEVDLDAAAIEWIARLSSAGGMVVAASESAAPKSEALTKAGC